MRANRDRLEFQHPAYLRWGEPLQVDQIEHLSLSARQLLQERPDEVYGPLIVSRPRPIDRLDILGCRLAPQFPGETRTARFPPMQVRRRATGDLVKPGAEPGPPVESVQVPVHSHEGVLGNIVGIVQIAGGRKSPTVDSVVVLANQLLERPLVAGLRVLDEVQYRFILLKRLAQEIPR